MLPSVPTQEGGLWNRLISFYICWNWNRHFMGGPAKTKTYVQIKLKKHWNPDHQGDVKDWFGLFRRQT